MTTPAEAVGTTSISAKNVSSSATAATVSAAASAAVVTEAVSERLQRHRSYHLSSSAQSKSHRRRFDNTQDYQHRRATSVRVRPTYIEADEDPNLPQPPVSISVASPDDEDLEVANTLGHR